MFKRIEVLKAKGYSPDTVLDIGAYHGHWTNSMRQIYNNAKYFLFEGINYPDLQQFNGHPLIKVFNVIVNDSKKEVDWYQMKNTGDSIFREKTKHFANCEVLKRESYDLNSILDATNILEGAKNIFIKIDCQGAEIPILKGASKVLSNTDFILLEIPFFGQYNEGVPSFLEHIAYMDSIGFVPFDMLENHYINEFNMQLDVLFINKNHSFNTKVNELLL